MVACLLLCVCTSMCVCMHTNSEHVLATVFMYAMFNCEARIYAHHVFMCVLY